RLFLCQMIQTTMQHDLFLIKSPERLHRGRACQYGTLTGPLSALARLGESRKSSLKRLAYPALSEKNISSNSTRILIHFDRTYAATRYPKSSGCPCVNSTNGRKVGYCR